jgi:hypothetical protein
MEFDDWVAKIELFAGKEAPPITGKENRMRREGVINRHPFYN